MLNDRCDTECVFEKSGRGSVDPLRCVVCERRSDHDGDLFDRIADLVGPGCEWFVDRRQNHVVFIEPGGACRLRRVKVLAEVTEDRSVVPLIAESVRVTMDRAIVAGLEDKLARP